MCKKGEYKNPGSEDLEERYKPLYKKDDNDIRSEFYRDYTRILHSEAYRRLKHKTQVFFNVDNDHICTRIEHVSHVESVSYSIAKGLGLDTELTKAIAIGHDLGHAPFGHQGETVIDNILKEKLSDESLIVLKNNPGAKVFWHERNGLRFVDKIELLPDPKGIKRNMNLTYAVRDGIISHCGEVDENGIKPRTDKINLWDSFLSPGQYQPFTWEGCVVKLSDKIAYLGRDIEDAIKLGFLKEDGINELKKIAEQFMGIETINTTALMHTLIMDVIKESSPEKGISLSKEKNELLDTVKTFNYKYIYANPKFDVYKQYSKMVLEKLVEFYISMYDGTDTLKKLGNTKEYSRLTRFFKEWIEVYSELGDKKDGAYDNTLIYGDLSNKDDYVWAIADFISGMTDSFAISLFKELITFE